MSAKIGPDSFTGKVDGVTVFEEVFDNAGPVIVNNLPPGVQSYIPPPNGELVRMVELGFRDIDNSDQDSGYDMSLEPRFHSISHTSSTLSIEMFASGVNWQGSNDESWGVDNFSVSVNTVPEPVPEANPIWGFALVLGLCALRCLRAPNSRLQASG